MNKHRVHTDYLQDVFNISRFSQMINKLIVEAKSIMLECQYDSIAFTGTSGSAVAYILSNELNVPLICIRKVGENSHYVPSYGVFEGNLDAKRYLIVDDFICGGNTIKRIESAIHEKLGNKAQCIGYLMYAASRSKYERDGKPVWTLYNCPNYEQRSLLFYG